MTFTANPCTNDIQLHDQDYARFEFLNNRCEEIMTAMGADSVGKPTPTMILYLTSIRTMQAEQL